MTRLGHSRLIIKPSPHLLHKPLYRYLLALSTLLNPSPFHRYIKALMLSSLRPPLLLTLTKFTVISLKYSTTGEQQRRLLALLPPWHYPSLTNTNTLSLSLSLSLSPVCNKRSVEHGSVAHMTAC